MLTDLVGLLVAQQLLPHEAKNTHYVVHVVGEVKRAELRDIPFKSIALLGTVRAPERC